MFYVYSFRIIIIISVVQFVNLWQCFDSARYNYVFEDDESKPSSGKQHKSLKKHKKHHSQSASSDKKDLSQSVSRNDHRHKHRNSSSRTRDEPKQDKHREKDDKHRHRHHHSGSPDDNRKVASVLISSSSNSVVWLQH